MPAKKSSMKSLLAARGSRGKQRAFKDILAARGASGKKRHTKVTPKKAYSLSFDCAYDQEDFRTLVTKTSGCNWSLPALNKLEKIMNDEINKAIETAHKKTKKKAAIAIKKARKNHQKHKREGKVVVQPSDVRVYQRKKK